MSRVHFVVCFGHLTLYYCHTLIVKL